MRSLSTHALITLLFTSTTLLSVLGNELPLDLGLAAPYAILAGSTVTSTGTVDNIGIFPGTALVGFPPGFLNDLLDSANGASGAQGALPPHTMPLQESLSSIL